MSDYSEIDNFEEEFLEGWRAEARTTHELLSRFENFGYDLIGLKADKETDLSSEDMFGERQDEYDVGDLERYAEKLEEEGYIDFDTGESSVDNYRPRARGVVWYFFWKDYIREEDPGSVSSTIDRMYEEEKEEETEDVPKGQEEVEKSVKEVLDENF